MPVIACQDAPGGSNCFVCTIASLFPQVKDQLLGHFPSSTMTQATLDVVVRFCAQSLSVGLLLVKKITAEVCDLHEKSHCIKMSLVRNLLSEVRRRELAEKYDSLIVVPRDSLHCFGISLIDGFLYDSRERFALVLSDENLRRCAGVPPSNTLVIEKVFGLKMKTFLRNKKAKV